MDLNYQWITYLGAAMKRLSFLLKAYIAMLISTSSVSATIINIPDDYPTIQAGIEASSDGDTVLVQPGTYVENINFNGHNIVLGSLFFTTGDTTYIAETIIDGNDDGSVIICESGEDTTTIIIGFTIRHGNAPGGGGILCDNNSSPEITNNNITDNIANAGFYGQPAGGGIFCLDDSNPLIAFNNISRNLVILGWLGVGGGISCIRSSPIIRNNVIRENITPWSGGGIHANRSNSVISENDISDNNTALHGSAIYCYGGNLSIVNNIITDNRCFSSGTIACFYASPLIKGNMINSNSVEQGGQGGGIACWWDSNAKIEANIISSNLANDGGAISCQRSHPLIIRNTIRDNSANKGGSIFCDDSHPFIFNNVIYANSANIDGGAIYCYENSCPSIFNNSIVGNVASNSGGAMRCENSSPIMINTILWFNDAPNSPKISLDNFSTPNVLYCDIEGGWSGEGNIDLDPLFRDAENSDYHLMATECGDPYNSPCIDGGFPRWSDSLLDCSFGLGTTQSDIGAYGHGYSTYHSGNIINVPDDYSAIQEAIFFSNPGDTVLVFPDTYMENISFYGREIILGSLFLTTRDTSYISSTIINGSSSGSVVKFENGEGFSAVITGFTLSGGYAFAGGGIFCRHASPIILNNVIRENSADSAGGGFYCEYSNAIITSNVFIENSASDYGGGIFCRSSSPRIRYNTMIGNSSNDGGGLACSDDSSYSRIINNTIKENTAIGLGGGVLFANSTSILFNNIILDNSAICGGGIAFSENSSQLCANNIVKGNSAVDGGGFHIGGSSPIIYNTIAWDDSATGAGDEIYVDDFSWPTISYCDIEGGWEGDGNIDLDPLFRDPENGDYHLTSIECGDPYDSPCIDVGHPEILDSLLDCSWGLGSLLSDMGAYGGGTWGQVGIDEKEPQFPMRFKILQNYPNPFNSSTTIQYELPVNSNVTIEIYDVLGRRVATLVNEKQEAGYHQIRWDAKDKASGMYFYRIQAGDYVEAKKMLLLK
jgi:hypothetical protein